MHCTKRVHNKDCALRRAVKQPAPNTSPSAGLARLEVLSDRQSQSLQAWERQVSQVQLKTRLLGRDVKPTLRKVSSTSTQTDQAFVLSVVRMCCN